VTTINSSLICLRKRLVLKPTRMYAKRKLKQRISGAEGKVLVAGLNKGGTKLYIRYKPWEPRPKEAQIMCFAQLTQRKNSPDFFLF